MKHIYILDTSALLSVQQIVSSFSESNKSVNNLFITTPEIIAEFKDQISKLRIESMLSAQELLVKDANLDAINFINERCKEIGNFERLSYQDRSILSLAWQESQLKRAEKIILLSDDFEILNTAKILKIPFKSVKTKGIRYTATFKKICAACGEILSEKDDYCPECGSTKILRKKRKGFSKRN